MSDLSTTFDTVTAEYDRWRPTYPKALYDDIFAACPVGAGSRALEIGIGTGQATLPVLAAGCTVIAVEPGENMAAFVREKFRGYPGFSVVGGRFEEFAAPEASFDLIYSATAFHWVDEEIGYKKALALLKPGGVFARFANRPGPDTAHPGLHEAIQAVYAEFMPRSGGKVWFHEEKAAELAAIPQKYGFTGCTYRLYRRTRDFTAAEYVRLLGTYSDHIALGEEKLRRFNAGIEAAINRHGGVITISDIVDLELAVKPY
ncbi:MAG: class I SAM-dependent methyltransferase [Clostridia bacterium]|nr:class I SAM-dependent methyltransferase [Clostridia bacterium]